MNGIRIKVEHDRNIYDIDIKDIEFEFGPYGLANIVTTVTAPSFLNGRTEQRIPITGKNNTDFVYFIKDIVSNQIKEELIRIKERGEERYYNQKRFEKINTLTDGIKRKRYDIENYKEEDEEREKMKRELGHLLNELEVAKQEEQKFQRETALAFLKQIASEEIDSDIEERIREEQIYRLGLSQKDPEYRNSLLREVELQKEQLKIMENEKEDE